MDDEPDIDINDIFSNLFGSSFGFSQFHNDQRVEHQNDIHYSIKLTLDEIYTGTTKKISFTRRNKCTDCSASKCTTCNGQKQIKKIHQMGPFQQVSILPCQTCKATGIIGNKDCKTCKGTRETKEVKELIIPIPKGANSNTIIKLQNEGHNLDKRGHLLLHIIEEIPHAKFKRYNNYDDLYTELTVSLVDSLCGIKEEIVHLDNRKLLFEWNKVVRHGDILKVPKEGLPVQNESSKFGDLYIKINVQTPTVLDAKIKAELRKLL
jgi:DnaJ family protein A protein 2